MEAKCEQILSPPTSSWLYSVHRATQLDYGWHVHPEIELTLITSGRGQRLVGDSIENYMPDDLVLIGSELPHAYVSAPQTRDNTAIVFQFKRDFAGRAFLQMPEFASVGRLLDRADRGLVFPPHSTTDVGDQMRSFDLMTDTERTLGLLQILCGLAESASSARILSASRPQRSLNHATQTRINDVCRHLNAAYRTPVSLADMAHLAHMSPTAFSRFFHRATGRTPTAYVTELRIGAACRLLIETDLPIIDIAARSGYNNLSNFNRRFRTAKQMTPREYRTLFRRTAAM